MGALALLLGCPGTDAPADDGSGSTSASGSATSTATATPEDSSVGDSTGRGDATGNGTTSPGTTDAATTNASSDGPGETDDPTTGAAACDNGELDGDETDVDCGGACPACPLGSACEGPDDCADGMCETGSCLGPAPGCDLGQVQNAPGNNWSDSYSVDGQCYCDSTFDHDVGDIDVQTPYGVFSVLEICQAIGPGPGAAGNPVYNDIQCGNGPANNAGDEDWCPGRVDQGEAGCCTAGPLWDLRVLAPR